MYTIEIEYTNKEDGRKATALTKGTTTEELLEDIVFFSEKEEYYCPHCNKTHKIKVNSITINFKTK